MENKILKLYERLFQKVYNNSSYAEKEKWNLYPGRRNNFYPWWVSIKIE